MIKNRSWKDRRVLITGATGIVGAWLVKDLLARGGFIVAFVRDVDPQSELYRSGDIQGISVVNGTLEEFAAIERAISLYEIDTVFHLGAQTIVSVAHRSPLMTLETNIRGTYNLLEACRIHSDLVKRVVIASSDKAYGESKDLPYREDMPLDGMHPYEVSKSCADLIARAYHRSYKLPVAIARCGNVYGGGDLNWSRIVPGTIQSLLKGERPVVRSDGTFVRDYIYVKDISRAYLYLAENLEKDQVIGQAFNFSSEKPMTVLEMIAAIQKIMDCLDLKPDIRNSAAGEIRSQYLSAEKARKVLGWKTEYDLNAGLGETIQWYREFHSSSVSGKKL